MEPPAICHSDDEAEDHISGLPDELLHAILVRLPSAAAAARTSVFSRRWLGVWARMPELVLCGSPAPSPSPSPSTPPSSALLDSVDAALNSYAAPTLRSLKIAATGIDRCDVPAHRIAPWLRFASQRLAGKLCLSFSVKKAVAVVGQGDIDEELALPICERATEIDIGYLTDFVLRPLPAGSFSALTDLNISCTQMDGDELGRLVSSPQCPRLRKLHIYVSKLAPVCDVSICSESLECLDYGPVITGKLEVNAPMLQEISVRHRAAQACIVAPKLEKVRWSSTFTPSIHQFGVARRHLQSLRIMHSTFLGVPISSTRLMERYDTAKELKVTLELHKEIAGYVTFLKEMDKLPICESLDITLMVNHHSLLAIMLRLLRRCSCIRNLELLFLASAICQRNPPKVTPCSISGCPCLLPENYRLDDITFDSLEEIQINFFTGSDEQEEFMKLLLSKCNMATLKRVDITVPLDPVSSESWRLLKGSAVSVILTASSNLMCSQGRCGIRLPPNIEDAHMSCHLIVLWFNENDIARSLKGSLNLTMLLQIYVSFFSERVFKLWKGYIIITN